MDVKTDKLKSLASWCVNPCPILADSGLRCHDCCGNVDIPSRRCGDNFVRVRACVVSCIDAMETPCVLQYCAFDFRGMLFHS